MSEFPAALPVMRTPRKVTAEITSRCNARCSYCYYFNNPQVDYRDLPAEEWLAFFDELGRLGVMDVTVVGGEPFMRPDLPRLLEGIVRNRMRYNLLSNGRLITDEMAAFIAGTGRCDYVQVSVDGSRAEVHDSARGKGSFAGAVRGIRILQRHRIPVAVRVTIHRNNLEHLADTARFLLEDLGLPSFSTNAAGYLGSCQQNAHELLLSVEERSRAMEILLELDRQYPGRIQASAGPLAEARMWPEMLRAAQAGEPPFSNGGRLTGCGCIFSELTVRADGAIVPCSMLAHQVLGYINRDSLQEVWRSSPELASLRGRRAIPLASFAGCAQCGFAAYCTGNCPGLAYSLTGQVNAPSPDACLSLFLQSGGRLPLELEERP